MARALAYDMIIRDKSFSRGLGQAEKKASGFQRTIGRIGGVIAGAFAGGAVLGAVKSFTDAARDSERVAAETEARIRSTHGATQLSAKGFAELAGKVSDYAAVDDDVIQGGENMLATFDKIKAGGPNQIFEKATKAAVDLTAGMHQGQVSAEGLQGANVLLGKALQDPIKGLSALSRVGVSFTQQQKDQIAAMVKAGDTAGAQGVILKAVNSQFAGSAGAAVTSGKRLAVTWGNMQEVLGGLLIPVLDRGAKILAALIGWVDRNRGAATALGVAIVAVTGFVVAMNVASKVAAATQAAIRGATLAWAAAQRVLNFALAANPIGLVIVAVAALAAGIIYAYKHSETFRRIVDGVWAGVKRSVGAAVDFIIGAIRGWLNIQIGVVQGILHVMGKLPGPMGAPFRAAEAAVKGAKATINTQLDAVQRRVNRLTGKNIPITATASVEINPDTRRGLLALGIKGYGTKFFAKGGRITDGTTPTADDVPIWASKHETVVSAGDSADPWFQAWAKARRIPGFRDGGIVGGFLDPATRATRRYGELAAGRLADQVGKGLGKAVADAAGGMLGNLSGPGGWRWQMAVLRQAFPGLALISGFRPGAITSTGNRSYHALGRAVDVPPRWDVFNWISARYGARTKELIFTPAGARQIWNGRHHVFTGGTIRQDHYNHVHWAYRKGGLIPEDVFGMGRSGRTYGFHGGETVVPKQAPATTVINVHVTVNGVIGTDLRRVAEQLTPEIRNELNRHARRVGQQAVFK